MYSIIYYAFNLDVRELAEINYPNKTTLCKCDAMQDDVCIYAYIIPISMPPPDVFYMYLLYKSDSLKLVSI
jgi:hypothetical protein